MLTRQADKVAAELGGADEPVLSTLLKFVTIGENEPTRRRVRRSTLTDTQWRIAEAFITARLLTSDGEGDDAILEVAHEALFRRWAPLQQAIEASADQLRWPDWRLSAPDYCMFRQWPADDVQANCLGQRGR